MEPNQSSNHYNEKLVSLPNLSIYYSTPEVISEPRVRSDFGLPADNVLFLCCQSLFKYLPHYDSIWPQIAAQVPKSTFVFIANKSSHVTSEFKKRFIRSFEGSSVDGESRMVVVPQLKRSDYFELNRMGDIYLDSLGWSGGNTTLESLTFSLPIVTWEGEFMRGRHSGAILKRMGLQPEIAASPEAYIQKAVEYGLSKEKRESIRGQITENRGRVFEDTEAIRGLESFIREAVAKA
jgi:predicted O-linked N-acetylglucosamine transferase (SPINDLY family)